jgi:hypothetical protein
MVALRETRRVATPLAVIEKTSLGFAVYRGLFKVL